MPLARFLASAAFVALLALAGPASRAELRSASLRTGEDLRPTGALLPPPVIEPQGKEPRLDGPLGQLVLALRSPDLASALAAGQPMAVEALPEPLQSAIGQGLMRITSGGEVQVYVHVVSPSEPDAGAVSIDRRLEELGCRIETRSASGDIVQARVPVAQLEAAASLPAVRRITLPRYGVPDAGSRQTAGDLLLRALQTRTDYHVDGAGVRAGVISDGIFGLNGAIALDDLPPSTFTFDGPKLVATAGGVTSVSFRSDRDLEAGLGAGHGAEGVALLEIVHDLAPAAGLFFCNFSTDLEFNDAVNFLAERTDVLVDDISFFGGPYDGTSNVSANAAAALAAPHGTVRAFLTSAGNRAPDHYEEEYAPSGVDGLGFVGASGQFHLFQQTGKTSDAFGLGPSPSNVIFLTRNQGVTVFLSWDDPPGASSNDYDLFLFRESNGAISAASAAAQIGAQDPLESLSFTNTGSAGFFDLRVQNHLDSAQPRNLEIFILERPGRTLLPNNASLSYHTAEGSIPMMADAGGGVISVGAIAASDPGLDDIEPFSSLGPTNDGRLKPEVVSLDGVSVTGSGGFPSPFFGTSAAVAHAAGTAALLLQMAPCLQGALTDPGAVEERALLREVITGQTVDLGAAGPDTVFGHGRNDAFGAATALLPVLDVGPAEITAECSSPAGALVRFDGLGSHGSPAICPLEFLWIGPTFTAAGPQPDVTIPLGRHEVEVRVSQNVVTAVSAHQTVTVRDTTPPVLTGAPRPAMLWPPNHRMEQVASFAAAADLCDPAPVLRLAGVTSDEPDDAVGAGDGQTTGDIQGAEIGTADATLLLRAERDGRGDGRVYNITYSAADASGNAASADLRVLVPMSSAHMGPEPLALEFLDASTLGWNPVAGALSYQIVRGSLDAWAIHPSGASTMGGPVNLGQAECVASVRVEPGVAALLAAADATVPAAGGAFFYLAQYVDGSGESGFGATSGQTDLIVSPSGCR